MGLIENIKNALPSKYKRILSGVFADRTPIFTTFGKDIYMSDFVNNAIDRVASEIAKIEIKSIIQSDDTLQMQNDDITRLFRFKPNPLQTTSDFLSNVEWVRRKRCNVFIYPQYEYVTTANGQTFKRYTAFYPLNPTNIYIGVGEKNAIWEISFDFADGSRYTLPYSEIIHLRWRRGLNNIIGGGDDTGKVNDTSTYRAIDALDKTIQGLPKGIEASLQIKGVYNAKALADGAKLAAMRDDFESHMFTSKAGVLATDLVGEFTPVNITAPNIPESVLKFLRGIIQERYGISAAILSGDYTGDQHSAFYQTAIEEFIVQFEQAMTASLFTPRELDVGHRIKCYYSKVNYLSTKDKMSLADLATKTRLMTLNQISEMLGMTPFEGGDVRIQSLNYLESGIANEYQLKNSIKPKMAKEGESDDGEK